MPGGGGWLGTGLCGLGICTFEASVTRVMGPRAVYWECFSMPPSHTVTLIQGHSPGGKRTKTFIRDSEKGGQRGTTEVEKVSPGFPGVSVSRALTGVEAMGHHHAATAPSLHLVPKN